MCRRSYRITWALLTHINSVAFPARQLSPAMLIFICSLIVQTTICKEMKCIVHKT